MPSEQRPLDITCALITGGAGGIGKALATFFLSQGKKVIIAGRTESKLKAACDEIGATAYYTLDTGDTSSIPSIAKRLISDYPELDCIVNNAGVQRPLKIASSASAPADFLAKADQEIDINIRGPMHLTLALLSHLQSKPAAAIINVSSVLGFIPFSAINPVYNGTKAWLHFWSMNLRTQLRQAGSSVRVVEIAPPMVETDLHREREDPDDNKKENNPGAMSIAEFMEEVAAKLESGDDMIAPGMAEDIVGKWHADFLPKYQEMTGEGN
ncbi:putative oxidoreductase DltE like protein [Verticillium longisporum]